MSDASVGPSVNAQSVEMNTVYSRTDLKLLDPGETEENHNLIAWSKLLSTEISVYICLCVQFGGTCIVLFSLHPTCHHKSGPW